MKKLIFTFCIIGLSALATTALAANLSTVLSSMGGSSSLSGGVVGTYWTDANQASFAISTKNARGTKAYATSSGATKIYVKDCASDPCGNSTTTDLLTADPSDFNDLSSFGSVLGGS